MVLPVYLTIKPASHFHISCHTQDHDKQTHETKERNLCAKLADVSNGRWTHRCSPSWPLQRRKMLFAELELWHHFAFKSEGTRSQFNANCASHRQNYLTLKKKKRENPVQVRQNDSTLLWKGFFFLVNWLTKLLLCPNTSAPGLFKKNPMNLKKPILCQHCQQWCFAARHCVGLQSWGALATVLYVCFFHPSFFSNKSGSTFRFRASKEVLLCLLSLRYHNIALRRWPSPDVFACIFGR